MKTKSRTGCRNTPRVLATVCLLLSCVPALAQDKTGKDGTAGLPKTVEKKFRLDEKIREAKEQLENIERSSKNSFAHGRAIEQLVELKKERIILFRQPGSKSGFKTGQLREFWNEVSNDHRESIALLKKASLIYEGLSAQKTTALAGIKLQQAWFTLNPIRFVREADIDPAYAEGEKLQLEALAIQEQATGYDSDLVLNTVLTIAEFYKSKADFENALTFYERYVSAAEKKYGATHKSLLPPLRELVQIAAITERQDEADAIASRISLITGRPEPYRPSYPDLINRATFISRVNLARIRYHDRATTGGLTSLAGVEEASAPVIIDSVTAKQIIVHVRVDENGNVIETKLIGETKNEQAILNAATATKIRPFVYKGAGRKMRGRLTYIVVE